MNLVARPWIIFFILSFFVISSSVGRPIQYSSDAIEEWKKTDEVDTKKPNTRATAKKPAEATDKPATKRKPQTPRKPRKPNTEDNN